jgi:CRISPR-associated protein Cas8a1/Csx13
MMLEHLPDAERLLVESVHIAIRQRFGAIADENRDNKQAMKNRFKREKERWRLSFSGAKTHEQVRHTLADLWSRAGSNRVLQENWLALLPLLREEHWRTARDLSLVALASYGSMSDENDSSSSPDNT